MGKLADMLDIAGHIEELSNGTLYKLKKKSPDCIDGCKEMHKRILHGEQISVQKSADEKEKSTDTADTEPNNPIKTAVSHQRTLTRSNQETEQSNRNQESARRRSTKIDISHYCCESKLESDGKIYFIENSCSGGEQWWWAM